MVHAPESAQDCIAELDGRNRCVRMTRNTEAVKNYPGSVRAVKCIKVNTGNVVIQKIMALFWQCCKARRSVAGKRVPPASSAMRLHPVIEVIGMIPAIIGT